MPKKGEAGFYEAREYMAECLINELEQFIDLKNKKVLDVGGERGEFCKVLEEKRHCQAINLEPIKPPFGFVHKTIRARANKLPFKDREFDLVLLRGVLQHIPTNEKLKSLEEIERVLKNDGIAYVMIPPWWSPLSSQNLKPFHYFGFPIAKHLANTIFSRKIKQKNLAELGLWPMTVKSTTNYIKEAGFKILKTTDIITEINWLTKVPVIKEVLSSVGFILTKS